MPYYTMRDGEKIYAMVVGKGETCILLHGYCGQGNMWLPAIFHLSRRYRFVLPDLRGYGRSNMALLGNKPAMAQYAEDIDDLMDALECEEAKLAGASLGALACLQIQQLNRFQRISHCLVIDHPPKPMSTPDWAYGLHPEVTEAYRQLVECFKDEKMDDPEVPFKELPAVFKTKFINAFLLTAVHAVPRLYQKWLAKIYNRIQFFSGQMPFYNSWYGTALSVDDYLNQDYDLLDILKEITIPVTIMMGTKSDMFPNEGVMYLDEQIPQSRLVRFENSGHALFYTEPIKFIRELKRFVEARKPFE